VRVRSLFLSASARVLTTLVWLVSMVILSRLLSPADIGLYTAAAAFIGIAHTLRSFGLIRYLIQEPELTLERQRTAFTVTLLVSWAVGAAVWLLRDTAAEWVRQPEVGPIVAIACINFFLIPVSSNSLALIERDMRFDALLVVSLANAVTNAVTACALAAAGWHAYSLAWGSVAGTLANIVSVSLLSPVPLLARPSLAAWRRVARFGAYSSATNIMSEVGRRIPDLLIGRFVGVFELGLFSRASGLASELGNQVVAALRPVAFAEFAAARRSGGDLKAHYLLAVAYVGAFSLPGYAMLAALARPLVVVAFGEQWEPAAPLIQVLCIAAAVEALVPFSSDLLLAGGAIDKVFRTELVIQLTRVAAFAATCPFGMTAIVLGQVAVSLVLAILYYLRLQAGAAIGVADLVRAHGRNLVLAAIASGVALAALAAIPSDHRLAQLAAAALGAAALWLAGVIVLYPAILRRVWRNLRPG